MIAVGSAIHFVPSWPLHQELPQKLMKIEIVTDTFLPDINGVAMTLGRLTAGLRERGHEVHVIHTGTSAANGETCVAAVPLPGYKEVRIGLPKPIQLKHRWRESRPDAIYVATEGPLGKSAIKAAKTLDIPVATGFHTNFHQYMSQYGLGRLEPMAMAYLRSFHQKADRTLSPSREMVERLSREGFSKVGFLGRGVDAELFHPGRRCETLRASWGARPGTPVAILVGRIAAEKNCDFAMEVFQRMREGFPDVKCVVVGDGPLRARLEVANPWVHFAGVRTGHDLAQHYASADVLIFPSETETFGNVLLEGLASGLATVSYDYAASGLHVRHSVNGFQASPGDRVSFQQWSLSALSEIPSSELRLEARATGERLGWDAVVREFEGHLADISNVEPSRAHALHAEAKRPRLNCRAVFISDLHLGTPDSKADEVADFLKHIHCAKLVLNGDIIDGWALRRGGSWNSSHSKVIRRILKMTERDDTDVIYLRGNHDEVMDRFLPATLGRIRIDREHLHITARGRRYLIIHGDGFDSISTHHAWMAKIGAAGYNTLLRINRIYNHYRTWRGREYHSISKQIKARVKSAVKFVDRYEELLQDLTRHRKCDGIICGHIHTPEDKVVGDIHYLNSGDWVESLTAVIEHEDGSMELVEYRSFMERLYGKPPGAPGGNRHPEETRPLPVT